MYLSHHMHKDSNHTHTWLSYHPVANISTVSYANTLKYSPSLQDKKSSVVSNPVAYIKPTASNAATAAPNLSDHQEDIASTSVEPLSRMLLLPTAQLKIWCQ